MKLSKVIIISFVLYCVVYAFSLNLDYVEGDDASNIAYHALGRVAEIQPPYSEYHGMMDKVLSVLPANETIVRVTGILMTAFCAWAMYILMMLIAFHLVQIKDEKTVKWVLLTIPFIAPEFFFIGLTYTPAVVAMCFVLLAHLLLIKQTNFSLTNPIIYLSILLFGLGVSFRWDVGFYLFLIGIETLFYRRFNRQLILTLFGVCLFMILATYGCIYISGCNYEAILLHLNEKSRYASQGSLSPSSLMGNIAFFTPAILMLFTGGLIKAISIKDFRHILFVSSTLLFIFPIIGMGIFDTGTLKRIFCIVPIILGTITIGYDFMLNNTSKFKSYYLFTFVFSAATFSLFGIKIYSDSTSWGPGFETRVICDDRQHVSYKISDKTNVTGLKIAFQSGFIYMSEEGPRPVGGYLHTLFSDWRAFNKNWNAEKNMIIDSALANNLPIIQEKESQYLSANLFRRGFVTNDAVTTTKIKQLRSEKYALRNFFNSHGDSVKIINFQGNYRNNFLDSITQNELNGLWGSEYLLHAQYSSTIRELCNDKKVLLRVYNPFFAHIKLKSYQ